MAWNVNQIYEYVQWLINKNAAGGISSDDFFYMWNSEQTACQTDLLGQWENRNNGKSGANTGLILNQTIGQYLAPFTVPIILTIANGKVTKPADFIYEVGLRINATGGTAGNKIDKINHGQITYVTDSVIDAPSVANNLYYAIEYLNYYSLLPTTVTGTVSLDYVAQCRDVKWAYTFDADDRQVYDPLNSVQPQWSQNAVIAITKRALKSLGVHYKDADFANFGNSNIQTGD